MTTPTPHDRIVFLSVPPALRGTLGQDAENNFAIDPDIPIPAEIPAGEDHLDIANLSWEMMISGMLRLLAEDPARDHADYYRRFVLSLRPRIRLEFSEAAILKARNGDFALALEILDALRGLFPDDQTSALNRALVLEQVADARDQEGREREAAEAAEEAARAWRALVDREDALPQALFNAAFFFMKANDFARAKACLDRFLKVCEDGEQKRTAQKVLKQIGTHELDDALFREAYDFIRMGEEEKGLEKIRPFLERHPQVWNGWFLLGWALRRLERWQDAAEAFAKAQELGGTNCDCHNERAICLMELGRYAEARGQLEKALRLEGDNVKVISNLGILAMKSGDQEEAAGFFRTVLELRPDDAIAQAWLKQIDQE